jgi:hypothetical protein
LIYKLETFLPKQYTQILKSCITERHFRIKQEEAYSDLNEIKAGVPQGNVPGPVLCLLYTSDLPAPENNTIATMADGSCFSCRKQQPRSSRKPTTSCQSNKQLDKKVAYQTK